ncbi:hypothetical protein [Labrenzia sp. CE80]|uniref:hypothetical protein n=1 Tax=Labrenzia sp. CE80 TaxID=1788986 RepID=UPI00129AB033|nr:hypothetical protein [Labrenzia sp. CE80]
MSDEAQNYYEKRLMRTIEELDGRIKELVEEKSALQRQLVKARWENSDLKDVNRTNSATRVMVEARVLDALKVTNKSLSSKALYREALKANFELKENTFRTHLHRMKEKGLLESAGWGMWKLVPGDIFS